MAEWRNSAINRLFPNLINDNSVKNSRQLAIQNVRMYHPRRVKNITRDHLRLFYLYVILLSHNKLHSVADLRGAQRTRPPGSKFFQFHAFFRKIRQIRMLVPPPGSWRPLLGEILGPPLALNMFYCSTTNQDFGETR